jgi:hypothetical protein
MLCRKKYQIRLLSVKIFMRLKKVGCSSSGSKSSYVQFHSTNIDVHMEHFTAVKKNCKLWFGLKQSLHDLVPEYLVLVHNGYLICQTDSSETASWIFRSIQLYVLSLLHKYVHQLRRLKWIQLNCKLNWNFIKLQLKLSLHYIHISHQCLTCFVIVDKLL